MKQPNPNERIENINPDKPETVRVKEVNQTIKKRKKLEMKMKLNDKKNVRSYYKEIN